MPAARRAGEARRVMRGGAAMAGAARHREVRRRAACSRGLPAAAKGTAALGVLIKPGSRACCRASIGCGSAAIFRWRTAVRCRSFSTDPDPGSHARRRGSARAADGLDLAVSQRASLGCSSLSSSVPTRAAVDRRERPPRTAAGEVPRGRSPRFPRRCAKIASGRM